MSIARSIVREYNRSIGSHAGGGIPRTDLSALWKLVNGVWVDSIGLSAAELWAALPAEHRSIYFSDPEDDETMLDAATIIANIEASEDLNDGGELVGSEAKGYAQYADGTAESVLLRAYRFFNVAYPEPPTPPSYYWLDGQPFFSHPNTYIDGSLYEI